MPESLTTIPINSNTTSRRRPRSGTCRINQSNTCGQSPPVLGDKGMFSRQHTRQLSTSPPLFPYGRNIPYEFPGSPSIPQVVPLSPPYLSSDYQPYPSYMPSPAQSSQWQRKTAAVQQGSYGEDEMNPFSMSYATLAGREGTYSGGGYRDQSMINVRPSPSRLSHSAPYHRPQAGADQPS